MEELDLTFCFSALLINVVNADVISCESSDSHGLDRNLVEAMQNQIHELQNQVKSLQDEVNALKKSSNFY